MTTTSELDKILDELLTLQPGAKAKAKQAILQWISAGVGKDEPTAYGKIVEDHLIAAQNELRQQIRNNLRLGGQK